MDAQRARKTWAVFLPIALLLGMIRLSSTLAQESALTTATHWPSQSDTNTISIDPELQRRLAADETQGYLIYFDERPDLSPAYGMSWDARGHFVMEQLRSAASRSQARVRAYLEQQQVAFSAFWVDNVIVVDASTLNTFNGLLNFPEIASLVAPPNIVLFEPTNAPQIAPAAPLDIANNISHIKAPDAWALGHRGQGMVVATIDTGVRYTHEALVRQYRGNLGNGAFEHNHNWWDPFDRSVAPNDPHGHGSHVTGTMVGAASGANQIGVAPAAEWIACQGFNPVTTIAALLECAEFMLAPWDLTKSNPDPNQRPHVINNSWGSCERSYNDWFQAVVDNWLAAGSYPVFAAGNAGNCFYRYPPGLDTVVNPARYSNVTAVGSSGTNNGQYAVHSTWGPTDVSDVINPRDYPALKPQVIAPGVAIHSAVHSSDSAYALFSGTSMSAPHVTALVALMWQAGPCLLGDYAATETLLEQTANPIPYATNYDDEGPGNVPNYATGWGEIDALAATQAARANCRDWGLLEGAIKDQKSGKPIAGATVKAARTKGLYWTARTNEQGRYTLALPAGTYNVSVLRHGYVLQELSAVVVPEAQPISLDLGLVSHTLAPISGTVAQAGRGWPLAARIDIKDYMDGPVVSSAANGSYRVMLVENQPYTFTVSAAQGGYIPITRVLTVPAGGRVVNFNLTADLEACSAPGYITDALYFEDFEDGDGGFIADGFNSSWDWGEPTSGPRAAYSGHHVWATNRSGNYRNLENSYLTSPPIDLSARAGSAPIVQWMQWLRTEGSVDYASLEVSKDGGASWQRAYGRVAGRVSSTWSSAKAVLDPSYSVNNFKLRFRLTSNSVLPYPGWYIDNVRVGYSPTYVAPVTLFSESFEDLAFPPSGWSSHNGDGGGSEWERTTSAVVDGTAAVRHRTSTEGATLQDGWLITPAIEIPEAGAALKFYEYSMSPEKYHKHSVLACTSGCGSPPTNFTQVASFPNAINGWREQIIDLRAYAGREVRLAFRYEGNNADDWFIDRVIVATLPQGSPSILCKPLQSFIALVSR